MLAMEPILVLVTIYLSLVYGVLYARKSTSFHSSFHRLTDMLVSAAPLSIRGYPNRLRTNTRVHHLSERPRVHRRRYRHNARIHHQRLLLQALPHSREEVEGLPSSGTETLWCHDRRPVTRYWSILARMDWAIR